MTISRPALAFAKAAVKPWAGFFTGALAGAAITEGAKLAIGRGASLFIGAFTGKMVGAALAGPVVDAFLEATAMLACLAIYNKLHPYLNKGHAVAIAGAALLAFTPLAHYNPAQNDAVAAAAFTPVMPAQILQNDASRKAALEMRPQIG